MILDLQLIAYFYVKHDSKYMIHVPDMVKMLCEHKLTVICTGNNQYYYPHIKYCDKLCIRYLYEELRIKFKKSDFENLYRFGNKSMLKYMIHNKPEFIDSLCIKTIIENGSYCKYLLIESYILSKCDDIFQLLVSSMYNDRIFVRLFELCKKTKCISSNNITQLIHTAIKFENNNIISFLYAMFPENFNQIDLISVFKTKLEIAKFIINKIDLDKIKYMLTPKLLEIAIDYRSVGKLRIILELMEKCNYSDHYDYNNDYYMEHDIMRNYLSDLLQNDDDSNYVITQERPEKNKSYILNAIMYSIRTNKTICTNYLLSK